MTELLETVAAETVPPPAALVGAPLTPPAPMTVIQETPPLSTPTAPVARPAQEISMSLDEFCRRLSVEERRSTLIGGFHYLQRRAGRLSDTETAYRAAFADFLKS